MEAGDIPRFNSQHLVGLSAAIGRSFLILQRHTSGMQVDRSENVIDSQRIETLQLHAMVTESVGSQISVIAWSDRWCEVNVRVPANDNWPLDWTNRGRLMCDVDTLTLALQATIAVTLENSENMQLRLEAVWRPLVGKGPINAFPARTRQMPPAEWPKNTEDESAQDQDKHR